MFLGVQTRRDRVIEVEGSRLKRLDSVVKVTETVLRVSALDLTSL